MRKVLVVLFLLILAVSISLSGCGSKEADLPEPAANGDSAPEETEENLADIILRGKQVQSMSYEYVLTMPGANMEGKVWLQGNKMKSEMILEGLTVITIFDGDDGAVYTYYPGENQAMKIQGEKSEQMADSPLDYTESVDVDIAVIAESVTLDGVRCKVVTMPGEGDEGTTKMWIREDYGIPVRIETSLPEGGNMVMEYKNIKIEPLPAGTFQLPAGVEIMDLGDMMKGMPQFQ